MARGGDRPVARRRVLTGGLLAGAAAALAAVWPPSGRAQSKPAITVHKTPT